MKNFHTTKNYHKDHRNSQNPIKAPKTTAKNSKPLWPGEPRKEPQSTPKDITGKDIEKELIENDPSKGSQTDMDTQKSDEAQNDPFETIEPEKDNPVKKEFKIGKLGNKELQEDESKRDETGGAPGNTKPSQRKF